MTLFATTVNLSRVANLTGMDVMPQPISGLAYPPVLVHKKCLWNSSTDSMKAICIFLLKSLIHEYKIIHLLLCSKLPLVDDSEAAVLPQVLLQHGDELGPLDGAKQDHGV